MFLFAVTIDPVIRKLESKYKAGAFADDIYIGHGKEIDKNIIIQENKEELGKYGLEVSVNKCKST